MEETRPQPIHTISCGSVRASIWRNENALKLFHDVTVCRCYRDGQRWASTCTFGTKDLPVLAKVVLDAHTWIHAQVTGQEEVALPPQQVNASII